MLEFSKDNKDTKAKSIFMAKYIRLYLKEKRDKTIDEIGHKCPYWNDSCPIDCRSVSQSTQK